MPAAKPFNLASYLEKSRKLDVSDLAWDQVPDHPLSADEIRVLTYTMDIESNTVVYLGELIASGAAEDPDVAAFLSCWGYEEYFHGHYLKRFLEKAGVALDPDRFTEVSTTRSPLYLLTQVGQRLVARIFRKPFQAVYFTWGAINELATLEAYGVLAARTQHPVLAELLERIIRDERRHFAFYFNQARARLEAPFARRLTSWIVSRYWQLVGSGERPQAEVDFVLRHVASGREGQKAVEAVTSRIRELPGLERWDGLARERDRAELRGRRQGLGLALQVRNA